MARPGCTLEDAIENIDIGGRRCPLRRRRTGRTWPCSSTRRLRSGARRAEGRRHRQEVPVRASGGGRRSAHRRLRRGDRAARRHPGRRCRRAPFFPPVHRRRRQGAGSALRREPAPERRVLPRRTPDAGCWPPPRSCRARSSRTTTSPTPTRLGMRRTFGRRGYPPASSSSTPTLRRGRRREHRGLPPRRSPETDPTSAFGGIIALNRPLDEATAQRIGANKAVRRGADRAERDARGARHLRRQAERARAGSAGGDAGQRWTSSASAAAAWCRAPTCATWRARSCAWSPRA